MLPEPSARPEVLFGEEFSAGKHRVRAALTAGPAVAWLTLFLVIPLVLVFGISFLSRGDYGELQLPLTLENYKRLLGFGWLGFDPWYPVILLRSILLGLGTAVICLLAGMPLAFFIAKLPLRSKNVALVLVVIPFWTNLLIRTYAWQMLLAPGSWPGRLVESLGLGALYPGLFAVMAGMICDFLPFMVLPLYASVEKLDWTIAEAAVDLGATRWQVFRHALLPQIRPGMIAGGLLVLLPATGQFVIPDLLGGAKTQMLGNLIQQQFGSSRDWPFGAATALAALALLALCSWAISRRQKPQP